MFPTITAKDDKITVLADHHIANRRLYREHIWKPARAMHEEVGSFAAWRRVLVEIEDFDGRLYFPDQRPFRHQEIYEMFPDVGNRWMGLFMETAPCGTAPKRYASPITYNRVRVIELYCRLYSAVEGIAA
ncbi:hypothetical protein [Roseovarius sp. M141]|uniref:hypothetical protein n=1 Tax=Roseovarius sp. M141 TaxID=2583806 RepID=UPI0020CBD072|nr:hypothetical protein [Roseovarius sp. M141]MCQ0091390.1 hypothetical protein [Roseovarius sp. M141]